MAKVLSDELFSGTVEPTTILRALKLQEPISHLGLSIDPVKEFVPIFLQCLRKHLLTRIGSPLISAASNFMQSEKKIHASTKYGKNSRSCSPQKRVMFPTTPKAPCNDTSPFINRSGERTRKWKGHGNGGTNRRGKPSRCHSSSPFTNKSLSPESPSLTPRRISPIKLSLDEDEFPSLLGEKTISSKTRDVPLKRITPTPFMETNNGNLKENGSEQSFGNNLFSNDSVSEDKTTVKSDKFSKLELKMRKSATNTNSKPDNEQSRICENKEEEKQLPQDSQLNSHTVTTRLVSGTVQGSKIEKALTVDVKSVEILNSIVAVYICIVTENLVSNLMLELSFLFQVMLANEKQSSEVVEVDVFVPLSNCIYFAVKSLENLKRVILLLERSTLQLMVANDKIKEFSPELHREINDTVDEKDTETERSVQNLRSPMTGVPFHAESDSKKTFISDRHFYSFSKQRDSFYSLVREWEENRFKADWSFEDAMTDKIKLHFQVFLQYSNHVQFADLFIRQLVEMCTDDSNLNSPVDKTVPLGLLDVLKKSDPERYQRLQERFTAPSKSNGPCPKPQFNNAETFFQKFIMLADSYIFVKNLADSLTKRITEIDLFLWDFSSSVKDSEMEIISIRSEFEENLKEVRLLGKFLGYITFLPYQTGTTEIPKHVHVQNIEHRNQTQEFFNPTYFLHRAVKNKRLVLTVPWMVEFLSMIDICSSTLKPYCDLFKALLSLYRSLKIAGSKLDYNSLFLVLLLGWLFESSKISENFCFNEVVPLTSLLDLSIKVEEKNGFPMDSIPIVSSTLLYANCPFLHDLKSQLLDAAKGNKARAGSFRKITPVSAVDDGAASDKKNQLRAQLIDNFFRYQPKFLKETCEFLTERAFNNIKAFAISSLSVEIKNCCAKNYEENISFRNDEDKAICDVEQLKEVNDNLLQNQLLQRKKDFEDQCSCYCKRYINEKLKDVFTTLLPADSLPAVVETTWKISCRSVIDKVEHWTKSYYKEVLEGELRGLFHKALMQRIKRENSTASVGKTE